MAIKCGIKHQNRVSFTTCMFISLWEKYDYICHSRPVCTLQMYYYYHGQWDYYYCHRYDVLLLD